MQARLVIHSARSPRAPGAARALRELDITLPSALCL